MSRRPSWEWLRSTSVEVFERISCLERARADRIFALGLVLFTVFKLLILAVNPLDLSPDEAHYWEWSRRLDWAYYSKGPVVAVLIAASTAVGGDTDLAVRLPALVLSAVLALVTYLFLRRVGRPGVALLAVALLHSGLFYGTLGIGMTTDPPLLVFWILGLWAAYEAVQRRAPRMWLGVGLATGFGTLSKYTAAIFLPSCLLFLIAAADPASRRRHLGSPWFWAGWALFALTLLPVAAWNLGHGGVNIAHNLGHVVTQRGLHLRAKFLAELLGGQLGLVGPVLLPLLGWLGWRGWRQCRDARDPAAGLLLFTTIPLAGLCLGVALTRPVYANWPMPLYLSGIVLLAHLAERDQVVARGGAFPLGAALLTNGVVLMVAYVILLTLASGVTFGVAPQRLALRKMAGWQQLGDRVETLLAHADASARPISFVVASEYGPASLIAFYARRHPRVLCANVSGRRMNQYDVWGGWEQQRGRDALIVLESTQVPARLARRFESVEGAGGPLPIEYGGAAVRSFHFFVGRGYDGSAPVTPDHY